MRTCDDVARVLDAGPLAGREVRSLSTGDGIACAVDIDPAEVRTAWTAARALTNDLGRWPVATTSWMLRPVDESVFTRCDYGDGDVSPRAICARAAAVTREDALDRPWLADAEVHFARDWDDVVEFMLAGTLRRVGSAPDPAEVLALDIRPDGIALERWLLEWEEQRRPTCAPEAGQHLQWFEPEDCSLLLLPTIAGHEVPAYLGFHGALGPGGHERLIAMLRSWHERFGAELVASWGTMLQFTVARPPASLDDAFELAVEQWKIASCTLDLAGVSIRDHARALVERPDWFLHDRP